ncbi:hypothetical protein NHX12_033000 [Muraenolepis orangiensis]|uniref:Uncharacterized protein n=1 Tax=Muraenolepis orangiensis TaxID=630683 RepID=A0A9Q0IFX9_9TELE|nr:hypothetical protein NHX12_033000 [Muraenolepis orangiensis]
MGVSMASVLEDEDPHQVDQQAGHRDRKQPVVVNIRRLQRPLVEADSEGQVETEEEEKVTGRAVRQDCPTRDKE